MCYKTLWTRMFIMNNYLLYVLCTCFTYMDGANTLGYKEIDAYLERKFSLFYDELKLHNRQLSKRDTVNIEFEDVGEITQIYDNSTEDVQFISALNETFIIFGRNIYKVTFEKFPALKIIGSSDKITEKIIFSKTTIFGRTILLTRLESGTAHIFEVSTKLTFIHSLYMPYSKDATFFQFRGNLFLIIINNKGEHLAEIILYMWTGTHFDEIQVIFTEGATKVTSFSTEKSEIIVVLRSLGSKQVYSNVYEFKEEMKKIYSIPTKDPIHIDTYKQKNERGIIVYEKSKNNTVFRWTGSYFIMVSGFQSTKEIKLSEIIKMGHQHFLTIPEETTLKVYKLYRDSVNFFSEKSYPKPYSKIFDIQSYKSNGKRLVVTVGIDGEERLNINFISIDVNGDTTDGETTDVIEEIHACYNKLESKVYDLKKKISEDHIPNVILGENLVQEIDVKTKLEGLQNRIAATNESISGHQNEGSTLIINGTVIFDETVKASIVTGNNIVIRNLNGVKWTPEQYLRYKEPQTITGPTTLSTIVTSKLSIPNNDGFMKDLLLRNKNQVLSKPARISNLTVNAIETDKIGEIDIASLYVRNNLTVIKGHKTFREINAKNVDIKSINQSEPKDTLSKLTRNSSTVEHLDANIFVENLEVETINGFVWENIINSVFWKYGNKTINGSLKFTKLNSKNITVSTLNGANINDYLTTKTDQTVSSIIKFNRIYGENMLADKINGINLENSSVLFGSNSTITGPVNFMKLSVINNLELIGKFNESFFMRNGDHILGTNESDLFQRYKGSVKIKGDLYLKDLKLPESATLTLSETNMDTNISRIYWTKHTQQIIPVHVTMQQGLSTPHIMTEKLNGINVTRYMLNNNLPKFETDYFFESVTVSGNVVLNRNAHHNPNLKNLKKEAVMTNGTFMINGKKTYKHLKADNLVSEELCGINTLNVLNIRWPANITGPKILKNVTVKGNLISDAVEIQAISNATLRDFLDKLVFIDKPEILNNMNFKALTASELHVNEVNGINITTCLENMEKMKSANNIKDLFITGDISIQNLNNVSTINDVSLEHMAKRQSGIIYGDIKYSGKVKIDNLRARSINKINLMKIVKRFLYKDINQTITAPYTFKNIQANNIRTPKINNVSLENLIDVSSEQHQEMYIPKGVKFSRMDVGSLMAKTIFPCQVNELLEIINDPSYHSWAKILVKGNITILDEDNSLYRIAKKMVNKNSNNIITVPVNFSENIHINNIYTKKHINKVDVVKILKDAVLTTSQETQVIHGHKWFSNLQATRALVIKNSDILTVNGENLKILNEHIVHKNISHETVILGKKTFFDGLQCERFYGPLMKNAALDKIVLLNSDKEIPDAIFDTVEVENDLNIHKVNNLNLNEFLSKRLLINSENEQKTSALYFFDDIDINNTTTPAINDVMINDLVFDTYGNITGTKTFTKDLTILGNIDVDLLDGINITAEYKRSILLDNTTHINANVVNIDVNKYNRKTSHINITKEYKKSILLDNTTHINANVTLMRPTQLNGAIKANSINSFPISDIQKILHVSDMRAAIEKVSLQEEEIVTRLKKNLKIARALPANYFYLEKSDVLQISVENIVTATTMSSKGYVLIHLVGEKPGSFCGLPDSCICPTEYTMEISPEHSVNIFINKSHKRVFSYNDEHMIAHFITSSVSSNSTCRKIRTKVLNELSVLNWNTFSNDTTSKDVFHSYDKPISGYISKVEFFTVKGETYVVIARYYDPVVDTHDLDCLVLKFFNNKTSAMQIQSISTRAVSEIHLFDTAKGIVLVIGNKKFFNDNNPENEETLIYRFNEDNEQFQFMRDIPFYGCMNARGIAIGMDSSIVLAHHYFPIQILRYYPEFDNYYYEQSFNEIEEPVIGISTFYAGGVNIHDAYLSVVTQGDRYYIYSFMFIEGWKQDSQGTIEGLKNLIPFHLNNQQYLFAPSSNVSSLLTIVTNNGD